jgi:hypothetical protein
MSFFSSAKGKLPFVLTVTASLLLVGCGPPDTLPYSEYDEITVSVYGYTPKNEEYYLGDTVGAPSCGSIAHSWAERNAFRSSSNWGYVCCTHEAGSKCYRKIR